MDKQLAIRRVRNAVWFFFGALMVAVQANYAQGQHSNNSHVFRIVRSAVVRIATSEQGHSGIGTIVSSEGHIVLQATPHLRKRPLFIFLADGRRANATLLGWSSEWNVAFAKVTDEGVWPYVEMVSATSVPLVNDQCFTIGYTLEKSGWSTSPSRRNGRVSKSVPLTWFSSSIAGNSADEPFFAFGPVFDSHGNMLGNTALETPSGDSTHLHASQIRALWPQLIRPGNIDMIRLFAMANSCDETRTYRIVQGNPESAAMSSTVENHVANCTVGLRKGRGQRWSGVIVSPEGWIATCGHGGHMPADELTVELSNGQNVAAKVTGVNPITDIALVKIQQQSRWPYAALADTTDLEEGTACWVVGYPSDRKGRQPLIRKTAIVHPKDAELSHLIYTDRAYSQFGGDSGGGVFDSSGRLLGINQGKEPDAPGRHPRLETFRAQWNRLADGPGEDERD